MTTSAALMVAPMSETNWPMNRSSAAWSISCVTDMASRLVPDLDHRLTSDRALLELDHGRADHVCAVGVLAGLRVGRARGIADGVTDLVGQVAAVHVLEPALDLGRAAQDARAAGLSVLVHDRDRGLRAVHRQLRGRIALVGCTREARQVEGGESGAAHGVSSSFGERFVDAVQAAWRACAKTSNDRQTVLVTFDTWCCACTCSGRSKSSSMGPLSIHRPRSVPGACSPTSRWPGGPCRVVSWLPASGPT